MEDVSNIWILLADTRKKLLWLWVVFTAIIISLFLFMTINNAFEGVVGTAWTWAFVCLLPMLALLFMGVVLNPQPSKVIKKATFNLVFYGALGYLLLVLATFIGLRAWLNAQTEEGIGMDDYFKLSYFWLLPFQLLLLVGAWFLYFAKTKLLKPNEKILLEYAQKKADYARRFGSLSQQKAFDLLVQNDMLSLFELMKTEFSSKNDERNAVIMLQGNYTRVKETTDFDAEDPAVLQRELNRISLALIDYIEQI